MTDDGTQAPGPPRVVRVLTFEGCPHAASARDAARRAIEQSGLPIALEEVDLLDPTVPAELHGYPSPTVLVGSVDVVGPVEATEGVGCRSSGAPTVEEVRRAIRAAWGGRDGRTVERSASDPQG